MRYVKRDITLDYTFLEDLGTGHFGVVKKGVSTINPDFVVAIKSVPKKRLRSKILEVRNEVEILAHVDHPNII